MRLTAMQCPRAAVMVGVSVSMVSSWRWQRSTPHQFVEPCRYIVEVNRYGSTLFIDRKS